MLSATTQSETGAERRFFVRVGYGGCKPHFFARRKVSYADGRATDLRQGRISWVKMTTAPRWRGCWGCKQVFLLFPSSEEAEHHEEEVNEIEVKIEGTHYGKFAGIAGRNALEFEASANAFKFLHIVGGKAEEYCHAHDANNVVHRFAVEEDIDHAGDNDTYKTHYHE